MFNVFTHVHCIHPCSLQEEYKNALMTNTWHRRLEFTGGETIVMHNPNVILHFLPSSQPDEWGTAQVSLARTSGDCISCVVLIVMFCI